MSYIRIKCLVNNSLSLVFHFESIRISYEFNSNRISETESTRTIHWVEKREHLQQKKRLQAHKSVCLVRSIVVILIPTRAQLDQYALLPH